MTFERNVSVSLNLPKSLSLSFHFSFSVLLLFLISWLLARRCPILVGTRVEGDDAAFFLFGPAALECTLYFSQTLCMLRIDEYVKYVPKHTLSAYTIVHTNLYASTS